MAGLGTLDVRNAFYSTLSGDSTITTTYGASVYQRPNEKSSFPYVYFSDDDEVHTDTFDNDLREVRVSVHVYSDKVRDDEAHLISNRATELLHFTTLSVSNWTFVSSELENQQVIDEPEYRHIITRFLVRICQ